MKLANALTLLALALAASSAFAFKSSGTTTYQGSGTWKMADGTENSWTGTTTVTCDGGETMTVSDTIQIVAPDGSTHSETMTWTGQHTGNGFFDVMVDGRKIGTSYCFETQCHMETSGDGAAFEETIRFVGDTIERTGSERKDGHVVAWTGVQSKVEAARLSAR